MSSNIASFSSSSSCKCSAVSDSLDTIWPRIDFGKQQETVFPVALVARRQYVICFSRLGNVNTKVKNSKEFWWNWGSLQTPNHL